LAAEISETAIDETEFFCNYSDCEDSMKLRPLNDRVLIKRADEDTKTAGGIIIPDTAQEKPMQGIIMGVGPGARDEKGERVALTVKNGDRVLFGKWSGTEVTLDGQELLIMNESDIMAVLEDKPAKPAKKAKKGKKAA
jgi:chaperonin GroES